MNTAPAPEIIEMSTGLVAPALAVLGTASILVAALGLLRMPDVFTRMHAASLAATLGVLLVVAAAAVHLGGSAGIRAVLIGLFLMATTPLASHALARATSNDYKASSESRIASSRVRRGT